MTAALFPLGPSLRRAALAALLLFAQVLSPSLALGMVRAGPAMALCRADGAASPLPDPVQHHNGCAVCPACQAPLPVLSGVPALPVPPVLHLGRAGLPSVAPPPPQARRLDAQPRGPPASAV